MPDEQALERILDELPAKPFLVGERGVDACATEREWPQRLLFIEGLRDVVSFPMKAGGISCSPLLRKKG